MSVLWWFRMLVVKAVHHRHRAGGLSFVAEASPVVTKPRVHRHRAGGGGNVRASLPVESDLQNAVLAFPDHLVFRESFGQRNLLAVSDFASLGEYR